MRGTSDEDVPAETDAASAAAADPDDADVLADTDVATAERGAGVDEGDVEEEGGGDARCCGVGGARRIRMSGPSPPYPPIHHNIIPPTPPSVSTLPADTAELEELAAFGAQFELDTFQLRAVRHLSSNWTHFSSESDTCGKGSQYWSAPPHPPANRWSANLRYGAL
ncbi:hypothetical protein T492DRAFT_850776 [Pavlovales sp. CCMP2436]|nr:hypothetical protein T492DRAFT_850776 [Pavlovales sp. CCMP2436]